MLFGSKLGDVIFYLTFLCRVYEKKYVVLVHASIRKVAFIESR